MNEDRSKTESCTRTKYTYDANGNMTVEALAPPNDLSYDDENRLISFSGGAGSGTYVYDDNSDRVQKTANGTTTVYIYSGDKDIAEYDNGAAPSSPSREFIYADGGSGAQLLARITGTTINYYHQDNISTVRLMTDSNGNDILNEGTYPFGESWYSNSLSNGEWEFTAYQHDTESGLDYALARFYDSRMGSFCSADPVGGDPTDPQTWNRYAYARNNPVNFIDPNGQSWVTALLDVLALVMQSFGLPTGEVALGQVADTALNLGAFGADVRIMYSLGEQGQSQQKTQQTKQPNWVPPVLVPPGYTICNPVNAEVTFVSPHQAHHPGAISNEPVHNGEAAINPWNYQVDYPGTKTADMAAQQTLKDADIRIYPDWSHATDMKTGLPASPPNYGGPVGPGVFLKGTDVIGPPSVRNNPNRPVSVDIYRSKKPAALNVPTIVVMKTSDKVHCPSM
jgi:RHS repeat-associated protein